VSGSKRPRLRVFLDSSVLIAGAMSSRGASYALLRLAEVDLIDARISPEVREETIRNLRAKAPAALPFLNVLLSEAFPGVAEVPDEAIRAAAQSAHPKDVLILAAATAQACRYLVTLNERDFWPDSDLIQVIRPGEMIKVIREQVDRAGQA